MNGRYLTGSSNGLVSASSRNKCSFEQQLASMGSPACTLVPAVVENPKILVVVWFSLEVVLL